MELEGRPPALPTLRVDPDLGLPQLAGPIEVAVPRAHAVSSRLEVGDVLSVVDVYDECDREPPLADGPTASPSPLQDSCATTALISWRFPVEVVGVFDALDPDDPFWDAALVSLDYPRSPDDTVLPRVFALFVHSDAFFGPVSDLLPGYRAASRLVDSLPIGAFDSADITADLERFTGLQTDLASVGGQGPAGWSARSSASRRSATLVWCPSC